MFRRSYKKNIGLLALATFLGRFGIISFWVLYLTQNGMNLLQLGLLESIYHLTSLCCEIPSGMLADRFSYKTNFYCSRLLSLLHVLLMILGQGSFLLYALAMFANALAASFDSGTNDAMLYESTVEAGLKTSYLKISSFFSGIIEATIAIGGIFAAFFVHGHLVWTYYIMAVFYGLTIVLTFFMKEPRNKAGEKRANFGQIILTVKSEFQTRPLLFLWMLTFDMVGVLMCMFYFYYQNELPNLASWQISLMMLTGSLFNIGAVYLASKIGSRWNSFKVFPILVGLTGVFYILALLGTPLVYVGIYLATNALYAIYHPIYSNDLQQRIPSEVRATMLSLASMFFSLAMIVFFPLTGWLIASFGFQQTFLGLGLVLCILFLPLQRELRMIEKSLKA